jgi:hypothetical protein
LTNRTRVLVSFEREIFPQVEIHETEADRTALEKELKELLLCSAASQVKGNFKRRFKERFGMETKSPLPGSERGFDEKMEPTTAVAPDHADDEEEREDVIWREIANHHTAIETLRAKEYRETVASCQGLSPLCNPLDLLTSASDVTPTEFNSLTFFRSRLQGKVPFPSPPSHLA